MMSTATANLINAYYDRFEDKINQPMRTDMLNVVGLKNMKRILISIYISIIILSTLFGNFLFFIFTLIAVIDSIFYSAPPLRFKKNMITGMIAFSGVMAIPFIAGWVINKPLWQLSPLFYLITYFFFTYFSIKNIPDLLGDKKANIQTIMTKSVDYKKGIYTSFLILFTPYIALLILILSNVLSGIYFIMYIFIPFLFYLLIENLHYEKNLSRLERLHAYGFIYAVTFLNVILFLSTFLIEAIIWIIFSYSYIIFFMNIKKVDSRHEKTQGRGKHE